MILTPDNLEQPWPEGSLVASLDLGSNSFHFLLASYTKGELTLIQRLSEKVQLAAGLDMHNYLDAAAQERGLDCLRNLAPLMQKIPLQKLKVVATNTLRVATNAQEFIHKAEQLLGVPIQVITGLEEARLVYLGVVKSNPAFSEQCLVIDIGGGSTEFIIGAGDKPLQLASLPMGCVSFSKRFFTQETITEQNFTAACQAAKQLLNTIKEDYAQLGWQLAYGSSGSMKTLALLAGYHNLTATNNYTSTTGNGSKFGQLTLAGLYALRDELLRQGNPMHWETAGIRTNRLQLIPAGLAICLAACEVLGVETLDYSDGALREGLLFELLESLAADN